VNRSVLSRVRKVVRDGADVTSGGRQFHTWGQPVGVPLRKTAGGSATNLVCGLRNVGCHRVYRKLTFDALCSVMCIVLG